MDLGRFVLKNADSFSLESDLVVFLFCGTVYDRCATAIISKSFACFDKSSKKDLFVYGCDCMKMSYIHTF